MRPSGANVEPTSENAGNVRTVSEVNPGSLKVIWPELLTIKVGMKIEAAVFWFVDAWLTLSQSITTTVSNLRLSQK